MCNCKGKAAEIQTVFFFNLVGSQGANDDLLGKLGSSEWPNGRHFLPYNLKNK